MLIHRGLVAGLASSTSCADDVCVALGGSLLEFFLGALDLAAASAHVDELLLVGVLGPRPAGSGGS